MSQFACESRPGQTLDAFFFDASAKVWNPTAASGAGAWQTWADASYQQYRVAATEQGTSGRYTVPAFPADAARWHVRVRASTLADSRRVWEEAVAAGSGGAAGDGDTAVDHNTGGVDALRVVDANGDGIAGVRVLAYVTGESVPEAETVTLQDGRWASPLQLSGGVEYTVRFSKAGKSQGEATVTP
jgi:hypothetical protein